MMQIVSEYPVNKRPVTLGLIWREPRVRAELGGLGRASLFRLRRDDPTFPKPIHLGKRSIGFVAAEVLAWVDAQRAARVAT